MAETTNTAEELQQIEQQLMSLKRRRAELMRQHSGENVFDYELLDAEGVPIRLSELFGERDDLILIHNMGRSCSYCTLWADGFEGLRPHLESRAGFALVSHDPPDVAADFAQSRGWTFRVLSGKGSSFTEDMGFWSQAQGAWPGFSAFHRDPDGKITRTAKMFFGPGDDFCPVWHFFDALRDGANGWEPQLTYLP